MLKGEAEGSWDYKKARNNITNDINKQWQK